MPKATYQVTIELTELELALLYHTVTGDRGERRVALWEESGAPRAERHFVSPHWLESKVFSRIAETQPEWLAVIERAQKQLSFRG